MKKTIKKYFEKAPLNALLIICFAVVLCVLAFIIHFRLTASSIGSNIGQELGSAVGIAIGSFEGETKGRREGTEQGKTEGLSAKNTAVEIANKLKQVEKLEVLVAGVKFDNAREIGKTEDYAALYLIEGTAIYFVDLSQAEITQSGDELIVLIPQPEVDPVIDERKVTRLAVYQRHSFTGKAEDGFDMYGNSMNELRKKAKEELGKDPALMDAARASALKQVEDLAKAVSTTAQTVTVDFKD